MGANVWPFDNLERSASATTLLMLSVIAPPSSLHCTAALSPPHVKREDSRELQRGTYKRTWPTQFDVAMKLLSTLLQASFEIESVGRGVTQHEALEADDIEIRRMNAVAKRTVFVERRLAKWQAARGG